MTLAEELATDPLGRGYAGMTDGEREASLAERNRTRLVPTEIGKGTVLDVIGRSAGNALLDIIDTAPDFRHVKHLLVDGRLRIDLNSVRTALDDLVTAGALSAEHATALKALAEQPISRAEELGYSGPISAEVRKARI